MADIWQTSCIIPFWNENLYLFDVLDEVSKVKNLTEIICVDDASSEDISAEILRRYPQIKLIRLGKNSGKTDAVREGLKMAQGRLILLVDADLRNLDFQEIQKANDTIQRDSNIDMLILRRIKARPAIKLYRGDVLFTGERILKKNDLERILNGHVKGWQLESAINTWMYANDKNVYWMANSAVNTSKSLKWGFVNGLRYDIRTFADMISAAGFGNIFRQILFYAKYEHK